MDLAHIINQPALGLVPIVDHRRTDPVRWVATSEIDDPAPFLEGGEVLLTTGLEMGRWEEEWQEYVGRLASADVVAIGLGVGFTHAAAPQPLIDACRHHGVDLFEVPRATRFVAIGRSVAEALRGESESAIRDELGAQRALTQAALEDDATTALVAATAQAASMAALVGSDGVALVGPIGERPELFDAKSVTALVRRMRPQGLRAASSHQQRGSTLLVRPVGVRGRPDRYLVVAFGPRLSDSDRSTLTTAIALLSLAEERRRATREDGRRLRARAVELLVAGDATSARVLLDARTGPRRRMPKNLTVLRGVSGDLEDALEIAERHGLVAILGKDDRELVVVLGSSRADEVAHLLVAAGLRVGVGEPVSPERAAEGYLTAGHALALTSHETPVGAWTDGVRRGVASLIDPERAASFGTSFLAPLAAQGTELVDALTAYLRHNGSLLKAASDLGLHRNTMRNRIERVEALLDRSLLDPQTRADAWVALQSAPGAPGSRYAASKASLLGEHGHRSPRR